MQIQALQRLNKTKAAISEDDDSVLECVSNPLIVKAVKAIGKLVDVLEIETSGFEDLEGNASGCQVTFLGKRKSAFDGIVRNSHFNVLDKETLDKVMELAQSSRADVRELSCSPTKGAFSLVLSAHR